MYQRGEKTMINLINILIEPFKIFFITQKTLWNMSPIMFFILDSVGVYLNINLMQNKPLIEIISFGLIKEEDKK